MNILVTRENRKGTKILFGKKKLYIKLHTNYSVLNDVPRFFDIIHSDVKVLG